LTDNDASGLNGDIRRLSSLSDSGGTLESDDDLGLAPWSAAAIRNPISNSRSRAPVRAPGEPREAPLTLEKRDAAHF
jgi:hypothetical protein